MTYRYRLHGLSIASDFALDELLADETAGTPDIAIRRERLPHDFGPARWSNDGYLLRDGEIMFPMPRVGRFLARGGRDLLADPEPGVDQGLLTLYLLGSALAAILHQRGLFPIHASAFQFEGKCIGFMGDSGAGKSTLAALLASRGFELVSEDVLVVAFDERRCAMVQPGIPILKLWPESIAGASLEDAVTTAESRSDSKMRLAASGCYTAQPLALKCLYQLRWLLPTSAETEIVPIQAFQGMLTLRQNIYRNGLIEAMDREQDYLSFASRLLRGVRLQAYHRPMDLERAGSQVDTLIDHLRGDN